MSAFHFTAQQGRDTALLKAYHVALTGKEPTFRDLATMQQVLDNDAETARIVSRVANELEPALDLIRSGRYNLGPVPLRGIADRINTALRLLTGDPT